jgi:hypothetical protein
VVLAGELPRCLDRLGSAGHEEGVVQVARRQPCQLGRELDRAQVGEGPVDGERELAHLRRGRFAHLLAEPVAEIHAEEAGEGVEVAAAGDALEVAAVAAHHHLQVRGGRVAARLREVQPEVFERSVLQRVVALHPVTISCD